MRNVSLLTLKRFYKGRRIFITGHTGFKGAWLAAWLTKWGANVTGYSLPPNTHPSLFKAARLDTQLHSILADIRDEKSLQKALQMAKPDLIFHLAAQPLVLRSYENPAETFSTNVIGTAHVLDCAAHLPAPCPVVVITSDKCYAPSPSGKPLRETDPLGGAGDPYSISKALAEQLVCYWREQLGYHPIATARAGNVLGGGDWAADRLLPELIIKAQTNQPTVLRMPYAVRPWQYVLDALWGYLLLGYRLTRQPQKFAQAWNFGPRRMSAMSVEEIARHTIQLLGKGEFISRPVRNHKETLVLRLNAQKAWQQLGWHTLYSTRQTLQHTVQFYRAFYAGENALALIHTALADYEKQLKK